MKAKQGGSTTPAPAHPQTHSLQSLLAFYWARNIPDRFPPELFRLRHGESGEGSHACPGHKLTSAYCSPGPLPRGCPPGSCSHRHSQHPGLVKSFFNCTAPAQQPLPHLRAAGSYNHLKGQPLLHGTANNFAALEVEMFDRKKARFKKQANWNGCQDWKVQFFILMHSHACFPSTNFASLA